MDFQLKLRKEDEIQNIRPYLCIQNLKWVTTVTNDVSVELTVQNVGFHAACDIYIGDKNSDDIKRKNLYGKHATLGTNNEVVIKINVNLEKSKEYIFVYNDIRGNIYEQELIFSTYKKNKVIQIDSCNTIEPSLRNPENK